MPAQKDDAFVLLSCCKSSCLLLYATCNALWFDKAVDVLTTHLQCSQVTALLLWTFAIIHNLNHVVRARYFHEFWGYRSDIVVCKTLVVYIMAKFRWHIITSLPHSRTNWNVCVHCVFAWFFLMYVGRLLKKKKRLKIVAADLNCMKYAIIESRRRAKTEWHSLRSLYISPHLSINLRKSHDENCG